MLRVDRFNNRIFRCTSIMQEAGYRQNISVAFYRSPFLHSRPHEPQLPKYALQKLTGPTQGLWLGPANIATRAPLLLEPDISAPMPDLSGVPPTSLSARRSPL